MEAGEAPGFRKEVNGFDIVESEDKDMEEEEKEKEAEDNEEKNKKKKVTPKKKPNAAAAKVVSTKAKKKTSAPEKETVKEKKARIKAGKANACLLHPLTAKSHPTFSSNFSSSQGLGSQGQEGSQLSVEGERQCDLCRRGPLLPFKGHCRHCALRLKRGSQQAAL
jgi:outer membrane biosynthesis protein TonB